MQQLIRWSAVAGLVALAGACTETHLATHVAKEIESNTNPVDEGTYKVGKPYQIKGQWYYPKEDPNYDETGIASWYGPNFHGKPTANGATFDQWALTAAHKTLPMPTKVRVTNLENGRSLVVTINDRGPFVGNRIIDLSRQSARLLGIEKQGIAKVRVQALSATGEDEFFTPVPSAQSQPTVTASPSGVVVDGVLPPPGGGSGAVAAEPLSPPTPSSVTVNQQPLVTYNTVTPTQIYVQAGSFTMESNATNLGKKLSALGQTHIMPVVINGQTFYRVRVGPIQQVADADAMLVRVQNAGVSNAKIIVEELK